jgi:hypothetical protein
MVQGFWHMENTLKPSLSIIPIPFPPVANYFLGVFQFISTGFLRSSPSNTSSLATKLRVVYIWDYVL